MIHVNPSKVATRRACNRCHQAKLKCIVDNHRKCQRCKQSNSNCTFSTPTRTQRQQMPSRSPSSTTVNPAEYQFDSWLNVDFDWGNTSVETSSQIIASGFTRELEAESDVVVTAPNPPLIHHSGNDGLMCDLADYTTDQVGPVTSSTLFDIPASITMAPGTDATAIGFDSQNALRSRALPTNSSYPDVSADVDSSDQYDERSADLAFWASKIMPLFVELTQHLQSLPVVNVDGIPSDSNKGTVPSPSRSHSPDRTFELSESFINVLGGMCFKLPSMNDGARTKEGCSAKHFMLDEASYLLVFSTYLRFLEVYHAVFRYLLACLSHPNESSTVGSCFYLPKLVLGSFSLAMSSETRPLLFVNLMESMLGRAKHLFHQLASVKTSPRACDISSDPFGDLSPVIEPTVAFESIQAREVSIIRLVDHIKTTLSRPKSFRTTT